MQSIISGNSRLGLAALTAALAAAGTRARETLSPEERSLVRQLREERATFKQKPFQRTNPFPFRRGSKLREHGLGGLTARIAWYQAHPRADSWALLQAVQ